MCRHGTDKVAFCSTNVTEWSSICNLFAHTYKTFGPRIDFVVRPFCLRLRSVADTILRQFANAGIAQMREMRSSDPTHFATTAHSSLDDLSSRPPSLAVIRVNLDGVLYTLHAALAYFRQQEKDQDGWRGKFVATGSNA